MLQLFAFSRIFQVLSASFGTGLSRIYSKLRRNCEKELLLLLPGSSYHQYVFNVFLNTKIKFSNDNDPAVKIRTDKV